MAASAGSAVRYFRAWLAAAVALSVALRLRYVVVPITTDEGGYLAVARAWRHGATPFVDVWVDRPQGLWLVFGAFDAVVGEARFVRLLALLFGALGVVAIGLAVRALAGASAGVVAAIAVAFASSGPGIEGYAANGELLGGAVGATSVAVAVVGLLRGPAPSLMWLAGLLGGVAWSLKQSGVDGPTAIVVWLLLSMPLGWLPRRVALASLARFVGGAGAVFAACAIHGWWIGWGNWWYAIAGYRLQKRSVVSGASWRQLGETLPDAVPLLAPLGAGIVVALVLLAARRVRVVARPEGWVLFIWPLTAAVTFAMGGQFFRHYWVTLTFPCAALFGATVARLPRRVPAVLLVAACSVATVPWVDLTFEPRHDVPLEAGDGSRLLASERAGEWLEDHVRSGDTIYAMCAAANLYAYAEVDPTYRYLWWDGVHQARNSQGALSELFAVSPPTWVVVFDQVTSCSGDAAVAAMVAHRYEVSSVVGGVRILHLVDETSHATTRGTFVLGPTGRRNGATSDR